MITFDPFTKRIILDTTYVTVVDIYSRWKEWVKEGDNAKWLPAFRTTGGDPLGGGRYIASYMFLLHGWKIRPMEANHTLEIEGNVTSEDGTDPVAPTLGTYRVLVQYTVPVQAQALATTGGGGGGSGDCPSVAEIAEAVIAAMQPQLDTIDRFKFTDDDRVLAAIPTVPVMVWDGSAWVQQ